MTQEIKVTTSSGNVFADLGLPNPDEMLAKAELARKISEIISKSHLSQDQAAQVLGIDQPKVSALMRGKLSGFSTERLFRFLNALGRDVEIVVKPKPKSRTQARTSVITVSRTRVKRKTVSVPVEKTQTAQADCLTTNKR